MIDLNQESPIPLREIPENLPKRNGKKISLPTIYRWVQKGLHGIRLETVYSGGIHCSTVEAIRRFDEAVTQVKRGARVMHPTISEDSAKDAAELRKRLGLG